MSARPVLVFVMCGEVEVRIVERVLSVVLAVLRLVRSIRRV